MTNSHIRSKWLTIQYMVDNGSQRGWFEKWSYAPKTSSNLSKYLVSLLFFKKTNLPNVYFPFKSVSNRGCKLIFHMYIFLSNISNRRCVCVAWGFGTTRNSFWAWKCVPPDNRKLEHSSSIAEALHYRNHNGSWACV